MLTGTQAVVTEALAGGGGGGREGHRSGLGGLPLFPIFNIGNLSLFCSPRGRTGGTEDLCERKRVLWCHDAQWCIVDERLGTRTCLHPFVAVSLIFILYLYKNQHPWCTRRVDGGLARICNLCPP